MKKVLIVEDEIISGMLINKYLQKYFKTNLIHNSTECKNICLKEYYDFVILDINLGNDSIDGAILLEQLKQLPNCKETVFIAITAYAMPGDKERFLTKGFDFYFSKPLVFKDLVDTLESINKDDSLR